MEFGNFIRTKLEQASAHNAVDHSLRLSCIEKVGNDGSLITALDKTMAFLRLYSDEFVPYVNPSMLLAGTGGEFWYTENPASLTWDIGHFCADYGSLVELGVQGIVEKINASTPSDETGRTNKAAFLEIMGLFSAYMERHAQKAESDANLLSGEEAENLRTTAAVIKNIVSKPPRTFREGLQLVWFAHTYLYLKPYTNTLTFGNLDRVLGRLYESSLLSGETDEESALMLIRHFYIACNCMTRDTQNLIVGGSDSDGGYFENRLSLLFLKAKRDVHLQQPSVTLKVREETSDGLWSAALDLLSTGGGMPSFINDRLVRESLVNAGFGKDESNTFCIVGCYEATPYGNTYGGTVCGSIFLTDEFALFFSSREQYGTFDEFMEAFFAHMRKRYVDYYMAFFTGRTRDVEYNSANPFLGCIMDGCIEKCRLPEQYGAVNNIYSVLFCGLGSVVDSLLCVKHFVNDTGRITLDGLREETEHDFPDAGLRRELRSFPDRFGSMNPVSQSIACKTATVLADLPSLKPVIEGIRSVPALFVFQGDIYTEGRKPTPDGRRTGERCSYGACASELLPHRDVTKVLASTAGLPLKLFPDGAPASLNLDSALLANAKGRRAVRDMVSAFFSLGGFHLHINISDPDTLIDAQKHPEQYSDLLIRISGHTAPFVSLDRTMQDALIERARLRC